MHRIAIFFFCVLAISSAFVSQPRHIPNNKIFGGRNTTIEEVPFQVALEENGEHICGGSIIASNLVLSACHYFLNLDGILNTNPENFTVRIESAILQTGGKVVNVSKITPHPNYNVENFDYDALVIELAEEIETSENAQIISLAREEPETGAELTVSGWGVTEQGIGPGYPNEILQSVTIEKVTHEKCQRWYDLIEDEVTERMICAGGSGEAGACKGDSGGPLTAQTADGETVLVGVVSWGRGCGLYGYPNVFVNVANPEIRLFILEQIVDAGKNVK